MTINIDAIVEAYIRLLIVQYRNKPKAVATIDLIAREMLADGVIFEVQDAFNIETAVGKQLDILGKYIGLDRYFTGPTDLPTAFGFTNTNEDEEIGVDGFSSPDDMGTKDGIFVGPADVLSGNQKLNDEDFRFLLKLKIVQNTSDHSDKSIDDNLFKYFGLSLYAIDEGDMLMTYIADPETISLPILKVAIQKGVLTRPMAVGINFILFGIDFFGFVAPETTSFDGSFGFASPDDFATTDASFLGPQDTINPTL